MSGIVRRTLSNVKLKRWPSGPQVPRLGVAGVFDAGPHFRQTVGDKHLVKLAVAIKRSLRHCQAGEVPLTVP